MTFELPSLRRETRYGMPAADQILFNRHFVTGYSYYFRQPKWSLEIIDNAQTPVDRSDNFRSDFRIPAAFKADLVDFRGSGFDRGHIVASVNQREVDLQNSETFLLSNMSPQTPGLNRQIWANLESAVRQLDAQDNIFETFVITGPIFDFDQVVTKIGTGDDKRCDHSRTTCLLQIDSDRKQRRQPPHAVLYHSK